MNLDDMDKELAAKPIPKLLPKTTSSSTGWRASLWTPMAHRNLCLACRYGKQHSHTDCIDPGKCQCPCYAWQAAMEGQGMD